MAFISATTNSLASSIGAVNPANTGGALGPVGDKSLSLSRFEMALARADATVSPGNNVSSFNTMGGVQPTQAQPPVEGIRFAQATQPTTSATRVDGVTPNAATPDTAQADRTRALRGLDLDKDAKAADDNKTGDTIIDGLSKLRGVFDNQEQAITSIAGQPLTNSTALINLQLEVVKYTMLMDVTSKLTGKSTQAFDTLMKGQ